MQRAKLSMDKQVAKPKRKPDQDTGDGTFAATVGKILRPRGIPTPEEKRAYLNARRRYLERVRAKGKRT